MPPEPEPIACTLTTRDAAAQALEWTDLHGRADSVEVLPTGARMRVPAELAPRVADLVRRETACCAFLDISTVMSDDALVIEVTSADPDAWPVISLLLGVSRT